MQVVVHRRLERGAGHAPGRPPRRGHRPAPRGSTSSAARHVDSRSTADAARGQRLVAELQGRPVVGRQQRVAQSPGATSPPRRSRPGARACPSRLAIFSPPIWRWAQCSQVRTNRCRWRPPTGRSRPRGAGRSGRRRRCGCRSSGPGSVMLIAEHSMCQPGRPAPIAVVPARLARPGALPEREVAHVVLAVLVGLDALAYALLRRARGAPACRTPARTRCGRRSSRRRSGRRGPSLQQRGDEVDHLGDVLGGARAARPASPMRSRARSARKRAM